MMKFLFWSVLLLSLPGCVELPADDRGPDTTVDSGLGLGALSDAGLQRPPTGAPYRGPQCQSGEPGPDVIVAGDGGAAIASGGDGGVARFAAASGGAGGESSSAPAAGGAASALPSPRRAGQLVISELMSNPAALADNDGEWIELYNPSANDSLALDGCALDDGSTTRMLPAGAVLAPRAYATLARTAQVAFTPTLLVSFSLGNSDDSVALVCSGVEIDRVRYGTGFPLAAGASMSLDPGALDAAANDQPSAWCLGSDADGLGERGTPGADNPPCERGDAGS